MENEKHIPETQQPMQDMQASAHIPQRTILLILTLGILAVLFFIIAIYTNPQSKLNPFAPTPTPIAQSMLSLQTVDTGVSAQFATRDVTKSFNVVIDSGNNPVTAVQMELSFDPSVLTNVQLIPGTFFPSPVTLLKKVDNQTGRISYALGIQPQEQGIKGKGIVATITYSVLPTTKVAETAITFLPKSIVTAQGVAPTVLKTTQSLMIVIDPKKLGIPTVTP